MSVISDRHVFYIAGFDPRGAGHYHRMYRKQAAKRAAQGDLPLNVSVREKQSDISHVWQIDTPQTQTTYEFLVWNDLVKAYWRRGMLSILDDFLFTMRAYIASGLIYRLAKAFPKRMMTGYYPPLFIVLSCSFAFKVGNVSASVFMPYAGILSGACGFILGLLVLKGLFIIGDKLAVFWLMRIYAFSARWAQGKTPGLEERLDAFADRMISVARTANPDSRPREIMIVAHSVGTMLAVPVLARVLRRIGPGTRISLLTLGQCIPLISFWPEAQGYRTDLEDVSQDARLTWVDYTAPTDGLCFPLTDPVTTSGLPEAHSPVLRSPRFFKSYTPEHYRKLRYDWYTMHFLYLMAGDNTEFYDFFYLTAGARSLREVI